MHRVILLLGTNLGDKKKNLIEAKKLIKRQIGIIDENSEQVESEAIGFVSQHTFINEAIVVYTKLSPLKILKKIKEIERNMGRINESINNIYTDRIIDIDVIYYNKIIFKSNKLQIPHYKNIHERLFFNTLLKKLYNY